MILIYFLLIYFYFLFIYFLFIYFLFFLFIYSFIFYCKNGNDFSLALNILCLLTHYHHTDAASYFQVLRLSTILQTYHGEPLLTGLIALYRQSLSKKKKTIIKCLCEMLHGQNMPTLMKHFKQIHKTMIQSWWCRLPLDNWSRFRFGVSDWQTILATWVGDLLSTST